MYASLNLRFVGRSRELQDLGWSREDKQRAAVAEASEWLPADPVWVPPWYRDIAWIYDNGRTRKRYPCDWPWRRLVIHWDGSVSVCCGVFDPRWSMGNVFRESLQAIWNNRSYQAARRSFRRTVEALEGMPCSRCSGILP